VRVGVSEGAGFGVGVGEGIGVGVGVVADLTCRYSACIVPPQLLKPMAPLESELS